MPSACPHCQQIDQVQKVSAIVRSGTSTSSGRIEHTHSVSYTDSTSRTALAARLKQPGMPEKSCMSSIATLSGMLGVIIMVPFGCIGGFIISSIANSSFSGLPLMPMLIGAIILPILFMLTVKKIKAFIQQRWPDQKLIAWERALERWDRLFYCGRCDYVFFPETQHGASADNIRILLYTTPAVTPQESPAILVSE